MCCKNLVKFFHYKITLLIFFTLGCNECPLKKVDKGPIKQSLKHYLVSGSWCPMIIFNVDFSNGAAAPKGLMTYGTTQESSESDIPATDSESPARRSERPVKRFESVWGQVDRQDGSYRVWEIKTQISPMWSLFWQFISLIHDSNGLLNHNRRHKLWGPFAYFSVDLCQLFNKNKTICFWAPVILSSGVK